ncbi:DUF4920 domain-containing protein [Paracrocinitomix mangrovi]|uniref:DUF4920 domain-containing protein n=1 Tax=Paracrocinitomix mangrovi TaxID=2862509 RepID=UPI001C8D17F3|nr:DUF4920 domain-containing protein [Paracrocinitomix mangrovi]UKN03321.1 DUF4920 domain-containing protein [Paracrocinitomix mangrovi]
MKKLFLIPFAASALFMTSCGGGEGENENADSTEDTTAVEEHHEEEGAEIAFNGEEREGYKLYGHTDMNAADAIGMDAMMTEYESNGSWNGKVNVAIDQVCQKAGCWITFKDPSENEIRVVFRDHYTIPIETASGTEAILMGALVSDTISVDMQKHYLDDAKEAGQEVSQEEYDAITEDKIELSFDCESILVKN